MNIVVRHYVADKTGTRRLRSGGRIGNGLKQVGPYVREVAVVVAQHAVVFPTNAEIEGQFRADLPIVLDKEAMSRSR